MGKEVEKKGNQLFLRQEEYKEAPCPECGGTRKVICPECDGTGYYCLYHSGSLSCFKCERCRGKGFVRCTKCLGSSEGIVLEEWISGQGVDKEDCAIDDILGQKISGLVEFTPKGSVYSFTFPSEFSRRYSGFSGKWECVEVGSGSYGTVYSCRQRGRFIALKVPKDFESFVTGLTLSEKSLDDQKVSALMREFEIISKLSHPHLLKLLAYRVDKRFPFLVYEYATHGSLEYQVKKGASMNVRDILVLAIQLADALRYLHAHGIVHGDVKPSNILFVERVAMLADYSTAIRTLDATRESKIPVGTPGWRAPEQVHRELKEKVIERGYQNKIDVYQLGNVILYILTGESIDGETLLEDEEAAGKAVAGIDSSLRGIVRRMMDKYPWNRPCLEEVVCYLRSVLKKHSR